MHVVVFHVEPSSSAVREITARFPGFRTDTDYRNLLTILFRSVEVSHPGAKTVVLTDDRTPRDALPAHSEVVRVPVDPDRVMYSRLLAYIEYLRDHAGSSAVLFLDPDIIVNADLSATSSEKFDIALTYRDLPQMPINDGVILINRGRRDAGLRFLERVRSIYDREFSDDPYWFGSQRAFIAALGRRFAQRRSDAIRVGGVRVRLLPCDQWNFSPELDEQAITTAHPDKRILHFKGDRKRLMPLYWQEHFGRRQGLAPSHAPADPESRPRRQGLGLFAPTFSPGLRSLTLALGLLAGIAWCLLLFGIGLDDLTNGRTKPGVIFSTVVLTLLLIVLGALLWQFVARPLRRRLSRN
jgi:hypothetical protein